MKLVIEIEDGSTDEIQQFGALLTGNDDDIVLAGERVMRDMLGWVDGELDIELGPRMAAAGRANRG